MVSLNCGAPQIWSVNTELDTAKLAAWTSTSELRESDSLSGSRKIKNIKNFLKTKKKTTLHRKSLSTCNLGGEGAARDVFVIELYNDVVVSRCSGQVGHGARPIFVVFTADLCFRRTFNSQRQTALQRDGEDQTAGLC